MPDADAVANFTIGGRELQFSGVGYHDKARLPLTVYIRHPERLELTT